MKSSSSWLNLSFSMGEIYPELYFRRYIVRHLCYLLFMDSQPYPHWNSWGLVCALNACTILVVPFNFLLPFTISPIVSEFCHCWMVNLDVYIGLLNLFLYYHDSYGCATLPARFFGAELVSPALQVHCIVVVRSPVNFLEISLQPLLVRSFSICCSCIIYLF